MEKFFPERTISTIYKGDWGERLVLVNDCHRGSTNDRFPFTKTFSFSFMVEAANL